MTMRPFAQNLPIMALLAASLAACASQNQGISTTGGDAFVLDVVGINGTRAVEQGLAQAQSFCGEHGRLFVLTNSQAGSSAYRLEFRCIGPNNMLPPAAFVASAPQPPARSPRGRRARPAQEAPVTGQVLGYAAGLPALTEPAVTSPWSAGTANIPPALPPVATTPLFAPAPGVMLAVQPLAGPRLPPADNSPLVALPRLGSNAVPESRVTAAAPTAMPQAALSTALPPVNAAPIMQMQPMAQSLPVIQAQPLPGFGQGINTPPPGFGGPGFVGMVQSPNPLPGASTALPPIAAGSSRAVPLPGGNPTGFSGSPSGFSQGFR